ncbi:MAG: hypothetical protein E8D41_14355 [Nitrospira sp.]|nr:MAG: hypothetical protein E8D41_14355 [Nitrospira sp.]
MRDTELTAERPEGTFLSNNNALQQIEQQACAAFDPALTEVFCLTKREHPPSAERSPASQILFAIQSIPPGFPTVI